jgi:hypothetical protein
MSPCSSRLLTRSVPRLGAAAIGHPWYPGEIVVPCQIDHEDLDEEEIPADIHRAYKAARETWLDDGGGAPEGRPFLVHFFDEKRFWGTVRPKQLSQLSEDQGAFATITLWLVWSCL